MPITLTYDEVFERFENGDAMCVMLRNEDLPATLGNLEKFVQRFIGRYDTPGEWLNEWSLDTSRDATTTDWEAEAKELEARGLFVYYDYFGEVFVFRTSRNLRGDIHMDTRFPICPRCNGYIPSNENPGAYVGARSRLDNMTEVCSQCGTEEVREQIFNGYVTDWRKPVPEDGLSDIDAVTRANREAGVCLDCARDVTEGYEHCGGDACQEEIDLYADRD
jgi:hypothetical protein